MVTSNPRSLAFVLLITALPMGFALAAGRGGGGLGAGVGAAGTGSAAVGGGAGSVGGGPPAGRVGGGSPGSNDPAGNGSAGTGDPSANARGIPGKAPIASPEVTNTTTRGGFIGGSGVGAPAADLPGGVSPAALSKEVPSATTPTVPAALQGTAEGQARLSTTGLAIPGPDGVSTVIVAARPCGVAAHETDGTTTCVGVPIRPRR